MKDLIVFDLDETLLDLNLDVVEMRSAIAAKFNAHGITAQLEYLYQGIAETTRSVAEKNPALALKLQEEVWGYVCDYERMCATQRATIKEGARELLKKLEHAHVAIYSNNDQTAIELALQHVGINSTQFKYITGRREFQTLKPSGQPVKDMLDSLGTENISRIFFVGDSHYDALSARNASALLKTHKVHFVAFHKDIQKLYALENLDASFIARDFWELTPLLTVPKITLSLSIVFMAYNEEDSLSKIMADVKNLRELYVTDLEAIIINDGSTDKTAEMLAQISDPYLKVIAHETNKGMGGSMKTGYLAATREFCVPLPADRQVRTQHLVTFLPHVAKDRVVFSTYNEPHSGVKRQPMSVVFRWWAKYVGGLPRDFAGAYLFETSALREISPYWQTPRTFVLSFILLKEFEKLKKTFKHVVIRPFRRQHGFSKEASKRNVRNVSWEVLKHRFKL